MASKKEKKYTWNKTPINENELFQRKVDQLPRFKNTQMPDPKAFADLMLKTYPDLFEALYQSEKEDKLIEEIFQVDTQKKQKKKKS
jgi:hypothetical protein